jgi:hypothetical protein
MHLGLLHQRQPGDLQVVQVHLRLALDGLVGDPDRDPLVVAHRLRQGVELRRGGLHLLVFEQTAHQLGARIDGLLRFLDLSAAAAACAT